jgi:ABC-type sugar transport system permease subunit
MIERDRRKLIIPFLAPALILYLVFMVIPAIQAFRDSFYKWEGFNLPKEFIGLKNFVNLFRDQNYLQAMETTMYFFIVGGIIIFALVFLLTAILSSGVVRGKKFFRAIIFYPNVVAAIALTTFWSFIYNPRFGLLNSFLKLLGLDTLILP